MKRQAFTILELMVVIAIAALVSSITFGALSAVSSGNKRTSCQSNLAQIYTAARQYSRDYDGQLPYRNFQPPTARTSTNLPAGGLGLWALYTYPALPGDTLADADCNGFNDDVPPRRADSSLNAALAGYIKSYKVFHCPLDDYSHDVSYSKGGSCATQTMSSGQFDFDPGDGIRRINPYYLSYQVQDDDPSVLDKQTYSSVRNPDEKRQLEFYTGTGTGISTPNRQVPDTTVITWCRFHRQLDGNGNTIGPGKGGDNVLFADGSVQSIPVSQTVKDATNSHVCSGWQRVPLSVQDHMYSATACAVTP